MQIERKIQITYRWWNEGLDKINPLHVLALEEAAQERIFEMLKEGYTSGELSETVHMGYTEASEDIKYNGWWEMTYV